jgi:lysyl-tRNA synthetase class 2
MRAAGGVGARDAAGLVAAYRMVADAGYRGVYRRQGEIGEEDWRRLAHLAEAWRRRPAAQEVAGLGRLGDPADGDCLLAECLDPNGRTCALLRFVPWAGDGLTLDLVRYDRDSGRTPVDFLLTGLLLTAAGAAPGPLAGVTRVSLGAARARRRARPPYQAYAPARQTRFLLYERRLDLPRVATATVLADRTA